MPARVPRHEACACRARAHFTCLATYAVDSGEDFADPILQARYEHLIGDLRCLVCQNESIADSNAPLAADLRREVREMLRAGKQDAEILRFMTDRYGDFVLFRPPFVARTWLLWLAPILLLIARRDGSQRGSSASATGWRALTVTIRIWIPTHVIRVPEHCGRDGPGGDRCRCCGRCCGHTPAFDRAGPPRCW